MTPITLDSFESFLSNSDNFDLISQNKFGVVLLSEDNNINIHYITESEFTNYTHATKHEDIGDLNGTYPWVRMIQ